MDSFADFWSRTVQEILGRAHGPLNFRLVVMPMTVVVLAIRAHLKDVREGKPVFLGAFITSPAERRRLLRSALKDVGRVLVVALTLDTIYQLLVFKAFYPGQALVVAVACAVVPYVLVRGPVTRLVHYLLQRRKATGEAPAGAPQSAANDRKDATHG
ncbi:MAG: hypothetical protein U0529_04035 [Thermoanaerobaculia bacterium]